jgi:hypothetical protein
MRPSVKKLVAAGAALLVIPIMLSGCIVCIEDLCGNHPPRMAMLHVYAVDYYSGVPVPFAQVELYERDWWSWDYQGTWPVNQGGYAGIRCGYLYYDGCGGREDEDFRVIVYAPGYDTEGYDIELSYYYPAETLTFYLMPYYAKGAEAGGNFEPGSRTEEEVEALGPGQSTGRVEIGGSGENAADGESD